MKEEESKEEEQKEKNEEKGWEDGGSGHFKCKHGEHQETEPEEEQDGGADTGSSMNADPKDKSGDEQPERPRL